MLSTHTKGWPSLPMPLKQKRQTGPISQHVQRRWRLRIPSLIPNVILWSLVFSLFAMTWVWHKSLVGEEREYERKGGRLGSLCRYVPCGWLCADAIEDLFKVWRRGFSKSRFGLGIGVCPAEQCCQSHTIPACTSWYRLVQKYFCIFFSLAKKKLEF